MLTPVKGSVSVSYRMWHAISSPARSAERALSTTPRNMTGGSATRHREPTARQERPLLFMASVYCSTALAPYPANASGGASLSILTSQARYSCQLSSIEDARELLTPPI